MAQPEPPQEKAALRAWLRECRAADGSESWPRITHAGLMAGQWLALQAAAGFDAVDSPAAEAQSDRPGTP